MISLENPYVSSNSEKYIHTHTVDVYICMVHEAYDVSIYRLMIGGAPTIYIIIYLFLEVSYSKGVSVGEQMEDIVSNAVIFQIVHQMSPIPLCTYIHTYIHTVP